MSLQDDGGFDYLFVIAIIFACLVGAVTISELEPAAHRFFPVHHSVTSKREKHSAKDLCMRDFHIHAVHARCGA